MFFIWTGVFLGQNCIMALLEKKVVIESSLSFHCVVDKVVVRKVQENWIWMLGQNKRIHRVVSRLNVREIVFSVNQSECNFPRESLIKHFRFSLISEFFYFFDSWIDLIILVINAEISSQFNKFVSVGNYDRWSNVNVNY